LVGTIILTSFNMGVWTFIGAVIRFYGWFGDARGSTSSSSSARWASLPPSSSSASWASSCCSEATSTTARAANCP